MSNITISEKLAALDIWKWAIAERIRHNMRTMSFEDLARERIKELDSGVTWEALEEVSQWFNWEPMNGHVR